MKTPRLSSLSALLALSFALAASSAGASSLASISGSISDSVESISDSVSGSSHSTKDALTFNEGDYRVVEMAADAAHPGQTRLTLLAVGQTDLEKGFYLYVREAAVREHDVRQDAVVAVKSRPYGVVVYGQEASEPFALVLADSWRNRLDPAPVSL